MCSAQPTLNAYSISLQKGPFKDCQHAKDAGYSNSGIYMIKAENSNEPMQLWCENSLDPGGWAVIQKRTDGSVNFFRNWDSYKVISGMLKNSTFISVWHWLHYLLQSKRCYHSQCKSSSQMFPLRRWKQSLKLWRKSTAQKQEGLSSEMDIFQ